MPTQIKPSEKTLTIGYVKTGDKWRAVNLCPQVSGDWLVIDRQALTNPCSDKPRFLLADIKGEIKLVTKNAKGAWTMVATKLENRTEFKLISAYGRELIAAEVKRTNPTVTVAVAPAASQTPHNLTTTITTTRAATMSVAHRSPVTVQANTNGSVNTGRMNFYAARQAQLYFAPHPTQPIRSNPSSVNHALGLPTETAA